MRYRMSGVPVETFLKRFFFIAYQSSVALGAGIFRERPDATEDDVWKNISTAGDYIRNVTLKAWIVDSTPGNLYADYVFGRMMKLGVKYQDDTFEITSPQGAPRYNYQSWALIYPNVQALIDATLKSLPGSRVTVD